MNPNLYLFTSLLNDYVGFRAKYIPESHPATNTPEYVQCLKDKAEAKRKRKAMKKNL